MQGGIPPYDSLLRIRQCINYVLVMH
jgi:hypothetical protein